MDWIFSLIGGLIFAFIWWIVLLPIFIVIATPYILIRSIIGDGPYLLKIRDRYSRVIEFWKENAWAMSP